MNLCKADKCSKSMPPFSSATFVTCKCHTRMVPSKATPVRGGRHAGATQRADPNPNPCMQGVAERGWAAAPPAAPLVACAADATLAQAAAAAVDAGVHRCYVLGTDGRAMGVVTLADMLRALTA